MRGHGQGFGGVGEEGLVRLMLGRTMIDISPGGVGGLQPGFAFASKAVG